MKGGEQLSLVEKLYAMDKNLIFSGQLFFRHQGSSIHLDMTERELFAVAGIVAVPKHVAIQGEHQYPLAGMHTQEDGLIIGLDTLGYDMKERARGKNIGGLLLEPIWRV